MGKLIKIKADDFGDESLETVTGNRQGGEFLANQNGKAGGSGFPDRRRSGDHNEERRVTSNAVFSKAGPVCSETKTVRLAKHSIFCGQWRGDG